jgi:hypothetical protein
METHASLLSKGLPILCIRAEDSFAAAHAAIHMEKMHPHEQRCRPPPPEGESERGHKGTSRSFLNQYTDFSYLASIMNPNLNDAPRGGSMCVYITVPRG